MKLSLKVLLVLIAIMNGCREKTGSLTGEIPSAHIQVDTTDKEIYDFMKEIIISENLDLKNGLRVEPDPNCYLNEPDNTYLNNFLIGSEIEGTYDMFDRCLSKEDINFMLSQKPGHRGFKWNISRLGFNLENRNDRYTFSIPLFSRDSTKVVMMIRWLCPGLCGSGNTMLFKKENNKWISKSSSMWWH